jgi:hypothetical protein
MDPYKANHCHYNQKQMQNTGLNLARVLWICIVVPAYTLFLVNIPAYFMSLHMLHAPNAQTFTGQLTLSDVHTLQAWNLSLDFYASFMVVISLLLQFSYAIMGVLLFWRRSDSRIALFTSFALMMLPFGFANLTLQALPSNLSWLIHSLSALGNASLLLCGFIFPDGRYVPRWTRWIALSMLVYWAVLASFPAIGLDSSMLSLVIFFSFVLCVIVIQLYRYHSISTPQQRQQTKWAMYGVSLAVAGNILPRLLYYFVLVRFTGGSSLAYALMVCLIMVSMLAIPYTLAMAILHYRLWDIDIIINRTLVYATLTVTLGLIFIGLTLGLQFLVRAIIQQNNNITLVASTLAIAALFEPLRRQIQNFIDRRFYRQRYDAAKTIAAFGQIIRNEVDLNQLTENLVTVVKETMQPAHVSLWLCSLEKPQSRKTRVLPKIEVIESEE